MYTQEAPRCRYLKQRNCEVQVIFNLDCVIVTQSHVPLSLRANVRDFPCLGSCRVQPMRVDKERKLDKVGRDNLLINKL